MYWSILPKLDVYILMKLDVINDVSLKRVTELILAREKLDVYIIMKLDLL